MGQTAGPASTDGGTPMTSHIHGYAEIAVEEINDA